MVFYMKEIKVKAANWMDFVSFLVQNKLLLHGIISTILKFELKIYMINIPKTVFKIWLKKHLLFLFLFLFLITSFGKLSAQGCECVGCQGPIPVSSTTNYTINISGATNNNLGNANQGVCGIFLDVTFEHIWSLEIILTAPSGQMITLMGPYDNYSGSSAFSNWDISFFPCADNVNPDPIPSGGSFAAQWYNIQSWGIFQTYTGSYHPYLGCLEDFNFGAVNGNWTVTVVNGSNIYDSGSFNGFSILFCDDNGLNCQNCDADAGDLSYIPNINLCEGDGYGGSIAPNYGLVGGPNNQYDYTYIISNNSIIQNYEMSPDFSTYSTGTYEVCGLSYLATDVGNIPPANGSMSVADLENMLNTSPPFCGDISDDCFTVTIHGQLPTVFVSDFFCQGDTYDFAGNTYNSGGTYTIVLPSTIACDTTIQLTLIEMSVFSQNITSTICQGDTFFVGNIPHAISGNFSDTLSTIVGCDSIVNLNLTVVDAQANIAPSQNIDCSHLAVNLDGSASSVGANITYLWT
ncbi:MAG TPA: hypothetical protein ENJ53_00105, partial [Phaeodactylibacter sp.]|nr:hypothetical protein [Phaeodactylibacter sp.]